MPQNEELIRAAKLIKKHCYNTMCAECIFRVEKNNGTGCMFMDNRECPQGWDSKHCNLYVNAMED